MSAQRTGNGRVNALKPGKELSARVEGRSAASPETVYDLLADLRTHATWGGERQKKNTRIVSIVAPEGPASVGTEFDTTGADPMGAFRDRSVVTEASRPSVFEFVTEAGLETKKGKRSGWTVIHRYELSAEGDGCHIAYSLRITRVSDLVGMLGLFNVPILSGLAMKASEGVARRGVRNLAQMAEERASAR